MTCCIRVSFESGLEMTSLWAGSAPNSSRQQPVPAIVTVVVSLMQKPCGAAAWQRPGTGLPLRRRVTVLIDGQHLVAQVERGTGCIQ
jgi:hypothetical protein